MAQVDYRAKVTVDMENTVRGMWLEYCWRTGRNGFTINYPAQFVELGWTETNGYETVTTYTGLRNAINICRELLNNL